MSFHVWLLLPVLFFSFYFKELNSTRIIVSKDVHIQFDVTSGLLLFVYIYVQTLEYNKTINRKIRYQETLPNLRNNLSSLWGQYERQKFLCHDQISHLPTLRYI